MNKLMVLKMMQKLFSLYENKTLNYLTFMQTIQNVKKEPMDDNLAAYEEMKFVYEVFKKYPYYQIYYIIPTFIDEMRAMAEHNPILKKNVALTEACLKDLGPFIIKRIVTEVNAHYFILVKDFCQGEYSFRKYFDKNICSLDKLLEIASNAFYNQQKVFLDEAENVKEEISKTAYHISYTIEKNTLRFFLKNIGKNNYKRFQSYLEYMMFEVCDQHKLSNKDKSYVEIAYYDQLDYLNVKVQKIWKTEEKALNSTQLKLDLPQK